MKGCVYMDNIFKKSEWELEEALKSIEDKIVDVDYDPARRNVRALKCIKLVIRYLKKMDESAQTIPNAIRQFAFILRTGEFRYISQERPMENVFFEFLSPLEEATYQLMKDTVYAAKWLVCYSDVYEKEDEEKRKQVRKAFIGIILEERKWERKREEKKKQEELRRVLEEIECEEDDEEEAINLFIMKVVEKEEDGEEYEEFLPVEDEDLLEKLIEVVQADFGADEAFDDE